MNLISASQLKLLIPRLPNTLETPGLGWDLDGGGFNVRFWNTVDGWGLIVRGHMILVCYIQSMIDELPVAGAMIGDNYKTTVLCPSELASASLPVLLDERMLCWEKGIFPDAAFAPVIEWAIPINESAEEGFPVGNPEGCEVEGHLTVTFDEEASTRIISDMTAALHDDDFELTGAQSDKMHAMGWLYDEDWDGSWQWIKGDARGGDACWVADLLIVDSLCEERIERSCGCTLDEQCEAYMAGAETLGENYTPGLGELQDAADARGEPGPLDAVYVNGTIRDQEIGADQASNEDWDEAHFLNGHYVMRDDIGNLMTDMINFFFEPNEREAVFAEMDETGEWGFVYSTGRAWILKELEWTESDLPGGGYDAKTRRVAEALAEDLAEARKVADLLIVNSLCEDADYTPTLGELQDAANARGEPGPLDKDPKAVSDIPDYLCKGLKARGWCLWPAKALGEFLWTRPPGANGPYTEEGSPAWFADIKKIEAEEPDLDYFEIAKGIREAASAYNNAVIKAHGGRIVTRATVNQDGMVRVDSIQMEMPL